MTVHRFRAMGCEVVVSGEDAGLVATIFERWERTFSRFRPDSELSRINASSAHIVRVSPLFARTLRIALDFAVETGGLVDQTLGAALRAAGYDRDFALLGDDPRPSGTACAARRGEVRLEGRLLRRPSGLELDLNGVVKALAVDEAVASLPGAGFVSAGGDLAVRGAVDVGLPGGDAVRVVRGGLATSGSASRRWRRAGALQHHLIDPCTGRPSESCWEFVTTSGASCLDADVAAKAAFLLGADGPGWLDERGIPGRFVARDGQIVHNRSWEPVLACI